MSIEFIGETTFINFGDGTWLLLEEFSGVGCGEWYFLFGGVEGVAEDVFIRFFSYFVVHADEKIVSKVVGVVLFEVVADDATILGFAVAVGAFVWTFEVF